MLRLVRLSALLSLTWMLYFCPVNAQISENVDLLYQWQDSTLTFNVLGYRYNEVWGFVENGREFAVIGSTFGTHIFAVTDPVNSSQIDSVPGALQGLLVTQRDYTITKDTYMQFLKEPGRCRSSI